MAKVISILMNKGGVSKTETSLNLAYGLSVKGKKVLLIDMDPSSNATSVILGLDNNLSKYISEGQPRILACYEAMHEYLKQTPYKYDIHDVLEDQKLDIHEAIQKTRFENLDLIPSSVALSTTDIKLKGSINPYNRLRRAIQKVEDEYDFILI